MRKGDRQLFTYHKKAAELRSRINSLLAIQALDLVVLAILGMALPHPWSGIVVLSGLGLVALGYLWLTTILRTRHGLDDQNLYLAYGHFRLSIPKLAISSASLSHDSLPRGLPAPSLTPLYRPENDTLYLLARPLSSFAYPQGLVAITLDRPVEARVRRQGLVQFTRLVFNLDEPQLFLASLSGPWYGKELDESQSKLHPGAALDIRFSASKKGPGASRQGGRTGASEPRLGREGESEAASRGTEAEGASGFAEDSPDSEAAIRLCGLEKRYGNFTAVQGINLTVRPGEVLAFLGSNGAGKTTTIKMMVGLLRPSGGQVWIAGHDVWAEGPAARRLLGYVPDVPILHEGLTAREFLWLVAGLYELPVPEGRRRTEELLAFLQLERWGDHLIRNFSLGMKRKMAIAAALVHRPQVLLLDEVTNGLDPRAAREIKDFITATAQEGTAVFLTTHILEVAQELAHRIAIIERGQLRAVGTLEELRQQAERPEAGLEEVFLALTGDGRG
ncbi:MAG: ABC transporter ATP-binding protein [Firmicutes bacterium]|nr:ABC transporter ATP-binding protein [Bacillota bacterium]MCL5039159.1 ABC transporter ATP-binding protein [Bacillota bacterium]